MPEETQRKTLLVVDDSPLDCRIVSHIFEKEYTVLSAGNGDEALKILNSRRDISFVVLDLLMPVLDGIGVLKKMKASGMLSTIPVLVVSSVEDNEMQLSAISLGALDVIVKPINPVLLLRRVENILSFSDSAKALVQNKLYEQLLRQADIDEKTGIFNRQAFCRAARELFNRDTENRYLIVLWDIDRFKVYNDLFGLASGDRLLKKIGSAYASSIQKPPLFAHWGSDLFVSVFRAEDFDADSYVQTIQNTYLPVKKDFEFIVRVGIYEVKDPTVEVALMCDRAILALKSVKNNFSRQYAYYANSMRNAIVEEQKIVSEIGAALERGEISLYFQPQYDYQSNKMTGAEALVRWEHPTKGLMSPGDFIPVLEKNGFIIKLDRYVWEKACSYLSEWKKKGLRPLPVSVNISRRDIYSPRLCDTLTDLIKKYDLEPQLLHLEITESAYIDNSAQLIIIVNKLRTLGFHVEMDDFGSGYSSLNSLSEVPFDMLKLDIKFLGGDASRNSRQGSILSYVVRMAHWIKLPVIAEGVEKREEAEYLNSIGCRFMQGFYFSKPVPASRYEKMLVAEGNSSKPDSELFSDLAGAANFFDGSTQSTLLFNSFLGGAAIIEYTSEANIEVLRINDKYFDVLGTTRDEYSADDRSLTEKIYSRYRDSFTEMLERALETHNEDECDICRKPVRRGGAPIWLHIRARYLASNVNSNIFYISLENVSAARETLRYSNNLSRRLSEIVSSLPGGILSCTMHGDGRIETKYFNDTAAEMFGYTPEEYRKKLGVFTLDNVHPDDREHFKATLYRVLKSKDKILPEHVYRHICKDGSWRWTRLTGRITRRTRDTMTASIIQLDTDDLIKSRLSDEKKSHEIEKQRRYTESLYNTIPCGILQYILSKDNNKEVLLDFNETAWRIFGYSSEEDFVRNNCGKNLIDNIFPGDKQYYLWNLHTAKLSNKRREFVVRLNNNGEPGKYVRVILKKVSVKGTDDILQCVFALIAEGDDGTSENTPYTGTLRDRYRLISEADNVLTFDYDIKTDTLRCSFRETGGRLAERIANGFVHGNYQGSLDAYSMELCAAAIREASKKPVQGKVDIRADFNGGGYRWHQVKYVSVAAPDGIVLSVLGRVDDIDDVVRKNESLSHRVRLDGVTGLTNKDTAMILCEKAVKDRPSGTVDAMLFVDIDNFKSVNDTMGHLEGDNLLKKVGVLLRGMFRSEDIVSRFGGDEFLVYMKNVSDLSYAQSKAESLVNKLSEIKYNKTGNIHCSIGVVGIDESVSDFKQVFVRADKALYASKNSGKNRCTVYKEQETAKI